MTTHCVHCGKPIIGVETGNLKHWGLGLGFYYYLIYFGLFASAAISFYSGCMTISENGLLGLYNLLYGVFALAARFLLAARKRDGWNLYSVMLLVDMFVSGLLLLDLQNTLSELGLYGILIGSIGVRIGLSIVFSINGAILNYLEKREIYFNQ